MFVVVLLLRTCGSFLSYLEFPNLQWLHIQLYFRAVAQSQEVFIFWKKWTEFCTLKDVLHSLSLASARTQDLPYTVQ